MKHVVKECQKVAWKENKIRNRGTKRGQQMYSVETEIEYKSKYRAKSWN